MKKSERARMRQIILTLAKHGLRKGAASPRGLRLALEELGPTFIKIGQLLSTRQDFLPEAYRLELEKLQSHVNPLPFRTIKTALEQSLGRPLEELFSLFEQEPLACASVAQVHRARLPGGEEVAVKIRRPGIRETILGDLGLFKRLAGLFRLLPGGRVLEPTAVVDELLATAEQELDFRHEAGQIERFAANNREVPYLTCPRVYPAYSTDAVLVMTFLEGIRLTQPERLAAAGCDSAEIGRKLAHNYCKQVFVDGFFHADPHQGNILVHRGGIAYLDFGIMGCLTPRLAEQINRLLQALIRRDALAASQALLRIFRRRGRIDFDRFQSEVESVCRGFLDLPFQELDLRELVEEIFGICRTHELTAPPQVVLLLKGLITLQGVVAGLAPEINVLEIAIPYAKQYFRHEGGWQRLTRDYLRDLGAAGLQLPLRLLALLDSALAGRLKVRMEHANLERSLAELSKMANRIAFALITAALIVGSSLIINTGIGPYLFGLPIIGLIGYIGAALLGLWLLVSILRSGML